MAGTLRRFLFGLLAQFRQRQCIIPARLLQRRAAVHHPRPAFLPSRSFPTTPKPSIYYCGGFGGHLRPSNGRWYVGWELGVAHWQIGKF